MSNTLDKVFGKGCMLDLNVSQWTGEKRLHPEDLGLTQDEVPASYSLGRKKLIPAEAIQEMRHWEYKARSCVARHSFPFPFGEARFVSRTELDECVQELDQIVLEFEAAADNLVACFSKHRLDMRAEFLAAAREAYQRRATLCGGLQESESEFVNTFLVRIDKAYPSENALRAKYSMTYVVFQVELPDLTRATYSDIAQDSEKIQVMREAFELTVRQRVRQFVEDTAGSLRKEAHRALTRTAEALRDHRTTKATLDGVRRMIERYERMDMFGDEEFKARLREFKVRVLDMYEAKEIKRDERLCSNVLNDIESLAAMAVNAASMKSLIEKCKQEVSI